MTPQEVRTYCEDELSAIYRPDDALMALCRSVAGRFVWEGSDVIGPLLAMVEDSIWARRPLSILRLGNGEGNAIGLTKRGLSQPRLDTFFTEFVSQNGLRIPTDHAVAFGHDIRDAFADADVLGVRAFAADERAMIASAIARDDSYAALGFLYARDFLQQGLADKSFRGKFITNAWIYFNFLANMDRLLQSSQSIVIVTGRSGLEPQFVERLGSALTDFIAVPVQGHQPESLAASHFYDAFPKVKDRLRRDLRGSLVLVGAGLFGKVYCHVAQRHGAVAIDLGSGFDLLAGLVTRPVHAHFDRARSHWIRSGTGSA